MVKSEHKNVFPNARNVILNRSGQKKEKYKKTMTSSRESRAIMDIIF